ncbi:alpha/beta hydrolase fold domain-containing protein [Mycolicibacterium sp. D5.8-2]|uniref:alpha/beta hydrolase fold domain-containing protein n=1 Tax=Mycolicibacterium sp. D5.8-2 TaxID=3085903 RepID=UPI00298C4382|nr:alpha/beta hydrolase fold domain-containing protein [Mycolicibacterium sp. D5.8-2]MDW5609720.1 alpha/beta hydrolase fold domain-containing protein [Mycolicibacterium sp. D5.8-2]
MGAGLNAVDPQLKRLARVLPGGYSLHRGLTVPRALMNLAVRAGRRADVASTSVDANVTVRVHRPVRPQDRGPALLWIHGGGTVMGGAGQEDGFCCKLTDFTDVSVVAVDHRLAPEHPYPTPLEDCYAALLWLTRQPWVDPARVAIGGASAGGGFAAALALLARDRGEVAPALQMLVYPMLDDRTGAEPDQPARVMWSARDNQIPWRWYLGGADPQQAVPARHGDLAGLPPAWIGVGTLDLFHDESLEYGRRLRAAGVPAETHIAPGAFHAFDLLAPNASVSQRFFASQSRAVRAALVDRR